jgi:acetylglutamate/LysW-gamma-L-alpha-aminoadipate kinase
MRIVVKIGGSLMKSGPPVHLVEDVAALSSAHQIVLVHGGGDVVTDYATRLGKEQRFVVSPKGIKSRYTDRETADIYQMVMSGFLAKRLVESLRKAGMKGISLSGTDGQLIQGTRKERLVIVDDRGRKVAIEGGYTGKVSGVNSMLLGQLLSSGYVPVVSPVAAGESGEPLNIDGDKAASAIATGAAADQIVFLTNVDGLTIDGKLVAHLTSPEAATILPRVGFGMQRKVMAAADAVESGVKEAVICSGTRISPLAKALAHDTCTVITRQ